MAVHRPNPNRNLVALGLVVGITALLYLPVVGYRFVWDDSHLVVKNRFLAEATPLEIFTRGFWYNPERETQAGDMSYYRPLVNLSFYLERREYGLNPSGYHLTNLLLHLAAVALSYLILKQLFRSEFVAGLGALAWGINPATNCIVAFISGRTYLLAMLLLLASLYLLLVGLQGSAPEAPARIRKRGSNTCSGGVPGALPLVPLGRYRRQYQLPLGMGLTFLGALLSLESALVFLALALVWLVGQRSSYYRWERWLAALLLAPALYFLLRLGVARVSLMPATVGRWALTEPLRVLNAFGQQLALFVVPFNQRVIYTVGPQFTEFSVNSLFALGFVILPPILLFLTAERDARTGRRRLSRPGLLGYGWMLLFLLPFANLLFLGPSGRMLYLAGFGLVLLIAALLWRSWRHGGSTLMRIGVAGAVGLYLAALAVQLGVRNPVWQNELTLARTMVREAPDSPGAHLNYGAALAELNRTDEAIAEWRAAIEANPDYAPPRNRLAFALLEQGDTASALSEFREVVRLEPTSADAHNNLGLTLKRIGEIDSSIVHYQLALRYATSPDTTLNNLGRAYMAQGDLRRASAVLKQALELNPRFDAARQNLIETYLIAGFPDSARLFRR